MLVCVASDSEYTKRIHYCQAAVIRQKMPLVVLHLAQSLDAKINFIMGLLRKNSPSVMEVLNEYNFEQTRFLAERCGRRASLGERC